MLIGIIGLGHIGYSVATRLHSLGHEIHSWTRSDRIVPWDNSTDLSKGIDLEFDSLFVASGTTRPNSGNLNLELATTYDLVSNFTLAKKTKLFYFSSGSVYGECVNPMSEIHDPEPVTVYGKAKLAAEHKLRTTYEDKLSVLRVGNIIDEHNPYGIVAHLATSIRNGVFRVFGELSDCRDYLAISDLQFCIEQLIKIDNPPGLLNLGSGKSLSLEQIVLLVTESLGARIEVQWNQRRPGDLSQTRLDVTEMRYHLKNNPQDPTERIKALIGSLN